MQVPSTVVKHLSKAAQVGYDKMRMQLNSENSEAEVAEGEHALDDGNEVRKGHSLHPLCLSPLGPWG